MKNSINRLGILLASTLAGGAACTNSSPGTELEITTRDLDAYTVSYRSRVRVPTVGRRLRHVEFVAQVASHDPIAPIRCPINNGQAFRVAVDSLGGIEWRNPVVVLKGN